MIFREHEDIVSGKELPSNYVSSLKKAEKTSNIELRAFLDKIDLAEDGYPFRNTTMYIRAVIDEIADREVKTKT